jgi:ABC-type Fe3+ transport system permease subunit
MVILKQAFDDSEPRTVSQWWYDDRKRVQWYTFWVAALVLILTIVFGVTQTASGIIQAWASVRGMHH